MIEAQTSPFLGSAHDICVYYLHCVGESVASFVSEVFSICKNVFLLKANKKKQNSRVERK